MQIIKPPIIKWMTAPIKQLQFFTDKCTNLEMKSHLVYIINYSSGLLDILETSFLCPFNNKIEIFSY